MCVSGQILRAVDALFASLWPAGRVVEIPAGGIFTLRVILSGLLLALSFIAVPAPVEAGEGGSAPQEEIDPDVLRKVKKLIRGTLSEDNAEREKAWSEIKNMGNLVVPGLIGLYRQADTTPDMMRSILIALGDSKDPRAGPALAEMLTSKDPSVRRDAARAMGDSGYKAGIKALETVAADAKEADDVRLFAAVAAAKLESETILATLAELLKNPKAEIRSRAVFALGKYGGVKQAPAIEKALEDSDKSVREDAVEALRLLKTKEAWGPLVKAAADSDYRVRNAAMDALRELTGKSFEKTDAWQEWWKGEQVKSEK